MPFLFFSFPGAGSDGALTLDHRPDNDAERARIEAAGGTVEVWDGRS